MTEPSNETPTPSLAIHSKWKRAEAFLAIVRDKQHHREKGMSGKKYLTEKDLTAIRHAWDDDRIVQPAIGAIDGSSEIAQQLFDFFGEMCRRNQMTVPLDISREIHAILAIELVANMDNLTLPPEQLISATVQHGVLNLHQNPKLMDSFRESPSIIKHAAVNYPRDPVGFLERIITRIEELTRDERFASLLDTPGIFKYAAFHHPSDPEGFLERVVTRIEELPRDERFASLLDTPGIFKFATVNHPSDPEGFLERVVTRIEELSMDERFASLKDTPGIFKRAATHYSDDPEGFLKETLIRRRIKGRHDSEPGRGR